MCGPFVNTGLCWAPALCVTLCSGPVGEEGRHSQNQEAGMGSAEVLELQWRGAWSLGGSETREPMSVGWGAGGKHDTPAS